MAYDVVILPTFAQAEAFQKDGSKRSEAGLFGQIVTTFETWIADLWELYGDGRAIIGSPLREALMRYVAQESVAECGPELSGRVSAAARCVRQAAGVDAFEQAVAKARADEPVEGLSLGEYSFLKLIARYEDVAQERGLVELGEAAALLARASHDVFPKPLRVLVAEVGALSWVQEQFFSKSPEVRVSLDLLAGGRGIEQAPSGIDVRFAFPAGRLAQPALVGDIIVGLGDDFRRIVVTCKDPLELHDKLQGRLLEAGYDVRVQASKPFALTDFGRVFLACGELAGDGEWSTAWLSDAAASFFSGLSAVEALKVDGALRRDRIASKGESVERLRSESQLLSHILEAAGNVKAGDRLAEVERSVQAASRKSGAWRAEQLAAIKQARVALSAAAFVGLGSDACGALLEQSSVAVSARSGECGPEVLITTQRSAAVLPPSCCDCMLVLDLTADDYPVAEKDDAVAVLFSTLGFKAAETALEHARREFTSIIRKPKRTLILSRPLGDSNADETYPAVVLEEFVDAYRTDPSDDSEVDNPYRLPSSLQAGLVERGEEYLFANARAVDRGAMQSELSEVPLPYMEDVSDELVPTVAPRRRDGKGDLIEGLCPSPSQIEIYLECPYQWFVTRRLGVEGVDEGFGALERGSFAHEALETFYRQFQSAGHGKVTADTLEEARSLMRSVTSELAAQQYEREPGSGRLVPANELEKREVSALCEQLVGFLDYEVGLLPTFHPQYFEYQIDADHAVEYAGARIVGMIDRIDVDDRGHAVIIDYKGSVNAEHEISGKVEGRCGKVQTRIYAQAVKRALGLDVVAALYVSYGRKPAVAGAYDPRVIDAAHLPGIRVDHSSCGLMDEVPLPPPDDFSLASLTFPAMLDETEAIVARALVDMEQGAIPPHPAYPRVCTYCQVLACPNRGA